MCVSHSNPIGVTLKRFFRKIYVLIKTIYPDSIEVTHSCSFLEVTEKLEKFFQKNHWIVHY
jgi:hypothetical protein